MRVPNPPIETWTKAELVQKLKKLQPSKRFDRILIMSHGRPCAIILSIPDWESISQKWKLMNARLHNAMEGLRKTTPMRFNREASNSPPTP